MRLDEVGLDRCFFYVKKSFFFIFGKGFFNKSCQLLKTNPAKNHIGGTESIFLLSDIFKPAAPSVFSKGGHKMRLEWVLMDIAKQSEEIIPVANRPTLETLLKEMSYAAILMIVIIYIGGGYALHDLNEGLA